ncbi:OsmC family protein [Boseongicola aestuarii]|jgi:organic hydroperoxide reductase OsmC/OhrA|uniref:OsmC-like protein n=1 Tax=Boseongicola aestuarii TaxID=1470561 RepID=A0A238IW57_9RHOB|nr:OsmC family protein [Boseongicola aestuarii]SMX22728.1 OsmC-like protein [Boseongicola aestuarii]
MHSAEVIWTCDGDFASGQYSRAHHWRFDGGIEVAAAPSPMIVPPPLGCAEAVDPEEAYIASISSCHMLWFLDVACRAGFQVKSYRDTAKGALRQTDGIAWIPRVDLHIAVVFSGETPDEAAHMALHDKAHHACFIANSVKTEIVVNLD